MEAADALAWVLEQDYFNRHDSLHWEASIRRAYQEYKTAREAALAFAPTYSDEDVRRLVEAARWARIFLNVKDISAADAELKLALTKFPKEH